MTDPNWDWGDTTSTANTNNYVHSTPAWNNANPAGEQSAYYSPDHTTSSGWNQPSAPADSSTYGNAPPNNAYGAWNSQQHPQQQGFGFGPNAGAYSAFPQQFMADPLLNTARQIGGQFAEQQKEKISQYLSSFHLKYYFAVDTSYVSRKLGVILFPFIHQDWTIKYGQGGEPVPAKQDVNAPDLYIPLMAFITYVLVAGFVFGIQQRFSPEKLGLLTTNALFYLILENIVVFVTKYVLNISQSLNVWHALSYSSYKYVGMVVCLLIFLVGGKTAYYAALAYSIVATVFFLLRSLKTFILDAGYSADGGRKRKLYLVLSITVFQSLIMWLLTSSVTSYMPGNYDIAKMAMSGMGLTKKDVPMAPDGTVDYEALLKMP
jgi:hypothetical protein